MALLKKIKSATLIETLTATVLIVIVFIVASLILNNLLFNSFQAKTHNVETRINELRYQVQHNTLKLPYQEELGNWNIELQLVEENNTTWLNASAKNKNTNKEVEINRLYGK
ncbi:hypothetical protein GCM10007424_11640 [Flavobacterium suaedae]|uniref:Type II secretion system protein n=1 Tax=Flavobacterium suaedae TaxID=1767027 RepID=A0ABQ1JPB0_9FLAO|nr:hypothetical protein [Flavobacterium suaedae]GGB73401.1 hypothetical protein GCM10007424_11640 [Flavobacterium suaedae]